VDVSLSSVRSVAPELITAATLCVDTNGAGFTDITPQAGSFVAQSAAGAGVMLMFVRHTSASLVIQENADRAVQSDLAAALERIAPENAGWAHDVAGPDDMPAHVKTMLTGVSLHIPVLGGRLMLGRWQGIYLVEHRRERQRREVVMQFIGARR
jgi:secondary thiamine-phosphate synthase enzyme